MAGKWRKLDGLTDRQRIFALEYRRDLNAKQAAIRAGFSRRSAEKHGPRLLKHPAVAAFLEKLMAETEQQLVLTAERVDREVARVAFFDPGLAFDAEGRLLHPRDMPEDVRRALAGFEEEALFDTVEVPDEAGTKKQRVQVGVLRKVRWLPKVEAIALGMKRLGLLVDKSEVKVKPVPDLTDEEWELLALARHQVRASPVTRQADGCES